MRMVDRARVQASCDQSGGVRDVRHEIGANVVGDLAESGEVDEPGVCRGTADNDAGTVLGRQPVHLVVVDQTFVCEAVPDRAEVLAGVCRGTAVGEAPAVLQLHPEQRVAGLQQGGEDRVVGAGRRVGLDVRVAGT
jgi:hypothetical protein